jgi:hypothetical protein
MISPRFLTHLLSFNFTWLAILGLCVPVFTATAIAEDQNFDDATELPKGYRAVKGEWKVIDGALTGAELKADEHAAVLNFGGKNTDSKISFRVRFNGAKFFHLSLNHAKGHLFRVILDPKLGLSINKDKDKKDPESKVIKLGSREGEISVGEWHDITVIISGKSVSAKIDDGQAVEVSHPGLAMEKTGYRLIVRGKSVAVDDIKVSAVSE